MRLLSQRVIFFFGKTNRRKGLTDDYNGTQVAKGKLKTNIWTWLTNPLSRTQGIWLAGKKNGHKLSKARQSKLTAFLT
jgi:hypothetical protein